MLHTPHEYEYMFYNTMATAPGRFVCLFVCRPVRAYERTKTKEPSPQGAVSGGRLADRL